MMWRNGVVTSLKRLWGRDNARCLEAEITIQAAPSDARFLIEGTCTAIAYEAITGLPDVGERVRIEVSALERGLGTGGHAMISARLDVLPPDHLVAGHVVKARYMPDQVMVQGVDEQDAPTHAVLHEANDLGAMPVVVADLHSALPAIVTGIRTPLPGSYSHEPSPHPRVVYIMTDGAALPMAYSHLVATLQEAGWLTGTVSVGQAWGGDLEAATIHNGLLAAKKVFQAQVAVVIQGPGNLGTDTPWGFSGLSCGEAVNAVSVLGGCPVACLRMSAADPRARHTMISHHSLTALGKVALTRSDVVLPLLDGGSDLDSSLGGPDGPVATRAREQAASLTAVRERGEPHQLHEVSTRGLAHALAACPGGLSTMGRGLHDDPLFFLAAAAAGRYARSLLDISARSL